MSAPWSRGRGHILGSVCMIVVLGIFSILCTSESTAAIPRTISYQGVLTDSSGTPLSGQYKMRFSIYASESGGTSLWTEEWTGVTVSNGLFNVLLGSNEPIDLSADNQPFDAPYWLKVEVDHSGTYEPLSPRHKLASAAYALRAATVEEGAIVDSNITSLSATKLTGIVSNGNINWAAPADIGTTTAGVGYFTNLFASGNVGIGTTSQNYKLMVYTGGGTTTSLKLEHGGSNFVVRPLSSGGTSTVIENTGGGSLIVNPLGGNVGIGVTDPEQKLGVGGSIQCEYSSAEGPYLCLKNPSKTGLGNTWKIYNMTSGYGNSLQFWNYGGDGWGQKFVLSDNGNVGIGVWQPNYKLEVGGTIRGTGYSCPNGDIAEKLPVHPDYELSSKELKNKVSKLSLPDTEKKAMIERKEISKLDPGTVVVISKGGVSPCTKENDTCLAGIISTSPAVKMASEEKGQYIALAGKVPCKVIGKIKAGDMLTTSTIEGHAQKAGQPVLGAVVGKALEDSDGERGVVEVWVGGM